MNRGCVLNILSIKTGIGRKKELTGNKTKIQQSASQNPVPSPKCFLQKYFAVEKQVIPE
jgi:hypothetical protein